jgi:alpha-glucosidase
MRRNIHLTLMIVLQALITFGQEKYTSPNGKITLSLKIDSAINWTASFDNNKIVNAGLADIITNVNKHLIKKSKSIRFNAMIMQEQIYNPVPYKYSNRQSTYNRIHIYEENIVIAEFRVYDYGVAYRLFVNNKKGDLEIYNEMVDFELGKGTNLYFPKEVSFQSHFERQYLVNPIDSFVKGDYCSLPFFAKQNGVSLVITESDLYDYANLFLEKKSNLSFKSKFPNVPLKVRQQPGRRVDRNEIVDSTAKYIAKIKGNRSLPWRIFIIGTEKEIIENDLAYELATKPNDVENFSWVKPGLVAWDWYNANNNTGVDFETGINTATYKYYIDFAAKFSIPYIIIDEGWTKTTLDVKNCSPEIDILELVKYGKSKNVDIILWLLWKPLDEDMEGICKLYNSWGVKGIKVDFMQRADQYMVNFYERTAAMASKYKLLVDFHGAYKPVGLHRKYPNVLNYEGVRGNENNKWSNWASPSHNVTLPYIRMVAGPMDYTPGAMRNATKKDFTVMFNRPMSLTTRAHQVAMYGVYESPLQMLCDAPSLYLSDFYTANFISKIPTVWDETKFLDGKIGEHIAIARRNGKKWYVAAMTNEQERELNIDLSFLGVAGFNVTAFADGINANKQAEDYKISEKVAVSNTQKLKIKMAAGGGWLGIFEPIN